jgi:hypothetical protein
MTHDLTLFFANGWASALRILDAAIADFPKDAPRTELDRLRRTTEHVLYYRTAKGAR